MINIRIYITSLLTHPLFKGSAIVFIGSMISNAGAYLYHLLVGRILGPVGYGELASLFSLSYLLNVPALVVSTVITKYVSTYYANGEHGKIKRLLIISTKTLALVSVVFTLVTIPLYWWLAEYLKVTSVWYVALMVISSMIFFLATILTSVLQGYQKFFQLTIFTNINLFLRLAIAVAAAFFGVGATILAHTFTTLTGYLLTLIPLRSLGRIKVERTHLSIKNIGTYAVPSMFSLLGITSLYSTDIMLVKHYFSGYEAGLYASVAVMGKVIYFAGSSVAFVLFPVVAQRHAVGNSSIKLVYSALLIVFAISSSITAGYYLFPEYALQLLFGSSYVTAAQYLGLFGIFITLFSLSNVIVIALLGEGATKVWIFTLTAALFQIGLVSLYHDSIMTVIHVNILVTTVLFTFLLLFYLRKKLH